MEKLFDYYIFQAKSIILLKPVQEQCKGVLDQLCFKGWIDYIGAALMCFWKAWTVMSQRPRWFGNMRPLVIFHLSIWKSYAFHKIQGVQFLWNCCGPSCQKSTETVWIKIMFENRVRGHPSRGSARVSRVYKKATSGDGLRETSQNLRVVETGRYLWKTV